MKRLTLFSTTLVAALAAMAAPYQYSTPVPPGIAAAEGAADPLRHAEALRRRARSR